VQQRHQVRGEGIGALVAAGPGFGGRGAVDGLFPDGVAELTGTAAAGISVRRPVVPSSTVARSMLSTGAGLTRYIGLFATRSNSPVRCGSCEMMREKVRSEASSSPRISSSWGSSEGRCGV
jgi:hypothetical protein